MQVLDLGGAEMRWMAPRPGSTWQLERMLGEMMPGSLAALAGR